MSRYGESFRMMVKYPAIPVHDFTNDDASLQLLQLIVRGYIEMIRVPELNAAGVSVIVNEEGGMKGMLPNIEFAGLLLVGPVVFIGSKGEDCVSLTDSQAELIDRWLTSVKHARSQEEEVADGSNPEA